MSDKGFVRNFGQESKGITYQAKGSLIKIDIFIHPERCLILCKNPKKIVSEASS